MIAEYSHQQIGLFPLRGALPFFIELLLTIFHSMRRSLVHLANPSISDRDALFLLRTRLRLRRFSRDFPSLQIDFPQTHSRSCLEDYVEDDIDPR